MSYHFFAASLPMLLPDDTAPMSPEAFLYLARGYLSARDMRTLDALATGQPSRDAFIIAWRRHETQLRNAVASLRAARRGVNPAAWLREHTGYDVALQRGVTAAFQEVNPLLREQRLDAIRWQYAGELAGFDGFSAQAIFAYYLRLQIGARAQERDPRKGAARRAEYVSPEAMRQKRGGAPVAES
jgi:hypothetical protein